MCDSIVNGHISQKKRCGGWLSRAKKNKKCGLAHRPERNVLTREKTRLLCIFNFYAWIVDLGKGEASGEASGKYKKSFNNDLFALAKNRNDFFTFFLRVTVDRLK